MELDDELCLCFHISKRKIVNYIRIEKPRRAAQISDCYGAGTGCGWCRPFLRRLFEQQTGNPEGNELPGKDEYHHSRSTYVKEGGGTPPPGATPIEPEE